MVSWRVATLAEGNNLSAFTRGDKPIRPHLLDRSDPGQRVTVASGPRPCTCSRLDSWNIRV